MSDVRLIDANELWKEFDTAHLFDNGNPRHIAQQTVEVAPTINPEDCREHGRWEEITVLTTDDIKAQPDFATMRCDKCDRYHTTLYFYGNPTEMMHYCPNCGAKMDGKEQQEKVCDTCRFNPPSSFDGKPCSQCSDDYSCWQRKEQDNA